MAQFVAFEAGVEVNGQTVFSVVNAFSDGKENWLELLGMHGIKNPGAGRWYPQQAWLDSFREISATMGDEVLFKIGQAIPQSADFPTGIDSLEKALKSIDIAYQMNHRGGEIGSYRLTEFELRKKKAVMICQTSYPSEFDRGIIYAILKKFRPTSSGEFGVELDTTATSRIKGNHNCTYKLYW